MKIETSIGKDINAADALKTTSSSFYHSGRASSQLGNRRLSLFARTHAPTWHIIRIEQFLNGELDDRDREISASNNVYSKVKPGTLVEIALRHIAIDHRDTVFSYTCKKHFHFRDGASQLPQYSRGK